VRCQLRILTEIVKLLTKYLYIEKVIIIYLNNLHDKDALSGWQKITRSFLLKDIFVILLNSIKILMK